MKILIADDEMYVRLELKALLEELVPHGEIWEAENGTELRAKLDSEIFNLAFIDIRMPGLTGLDVLAEFPDLSRKTILVILTGYSDFNYARKAISLGVSEYMLKPVTKDDLASFLKRIIPSIRILDQTVSDIDSKLVSDAEKIVYRRYKEQIGVAQIADQLNVSPNYLSSQFKKNRNRTLTSYITELRLKTALEMLKLPGANIKTISENVGYQSRRHFSRLFREKYGCSPSEFINNN